MKTWIEGRDKLDTSGGRLQGQEGPAAKHKPVERVYRVAEVAELLRLDARTVRKYIALDMEEKAPIPYDGWFKLPNGQIRIKEWAVLGLMEK